MTRSYLPLLLLLLLLSPTLSQLCPLATTNSDLLQSGTTTINNAYTNNPARR